MDLETAQRLERLEAQVAILYRHLGLNGHEEFLPPPPYLPPPAPGHGGEPRDAVPGPPRDPRLSQAFFDALAADKKIQAIKLYREATGVGLKEAKDYVDSLDPHYRKRR
ncbi:MAG TPA: 50S ribosomal protein L7/L12 [Actinospica sp.]|nr:50S ribosomal protein L7/L12 [Actinospica sp.]